MHGIGVSAVNAHTAHREWATRPPDERYASVQALHEAARARRIRTMERDIETGEFRTQAVASDALALCEAPDRQAALTHWSFEQLAAIAGAPPKYLRSLPAPIASDAINYGLQRHRRQQHQLFVDRDAPWTVHAITSSRYARVHHDELATRVLDLMAAHPAWSPPLGYKDGVYGAERVPSGAYLGDRDMFLFLVDGNRDLEDPSDSTRAGLFRGFILRNSDVGAAALTLDVFLFRTVCANHIIWGFQHVAGFRRRHVGASIQDAWTTSLDAVRAALDADPSADRTLLLRSTTQELGPTRDAVLDAVVQRLELSQKQAAEAYPGGTARDESPICLGLRAGTDKAQSTHTLAGWTVRSGCRRQSSPDHGSLTGPPPCGHIPARRSSSLQVPRGCGSRAHPPGRARSRALPSAAPRSDRLYRRCAPCANRPTNANRHEDHETARTHFRIGDVDFVHRSFPNSSSSRTTCPGRHG